MSKFEVKLRYIRCQQTLNVPFPLLQDIGTPTYSRMMSERSIGHRFSGLNFDLNTMSLTAMLHSQVAIVTSVVGESFLHLGTYFQYV